MSCGSPDKAAPAERSDPAAKERPDISRYETGKIEGIADALLEGHLADVVAVVDDGNTHVVEVEHGAHVFCHRCAGGAGDAFRIGLAARFPLAKRPAFRQVAVTGIVCRGLICDHVGTNAASHQLGKNLGCITEKSN